MPKLDAVSADQKISGAADGRADTGYYVGASAGIV